MNSIADELQAVMGWCHRQSVFSSGDVDELFPVCLCAAMSEW